MISDKRLQQALEDVKESAEAIWEHDRIKDKAPKKMWQRAVAFHKEDLYNALYRLLDELELRHSQVEQVKELLDELEGKEFENALKP